MEEIVEASEKLFTLAGHLDRAKDLLVLPVRQEEPGKCLDAKLLKTVAADIVGSAVRFYQHVADW